MKGTILMKRFLAILMAITMLALLAGCTEPSGDPSTGDEGDKPQEGFGFTLSGVELVPGTAYPADKLPEPASVSTIPSCAIEGTDNVYNFTTVEVTAFQDSSGEVIYSIYILDANTSTAEGLYLGDPLSRATELYGADYQRNGTQVTYKKGSTLLVLLLQNECVTSIEYRMVTE